MKSNFLFFLFIFFVELCTAQTVDFYGKKVNTNICNQLGFSNNEEAKNYLDKICDAADLINNYVMIPCPDIGTCLATVSDGVYYILYDNNFLNRLKSLGFTEKKINNSSSSFTDWAAITVLAHELGHHALGHFNKLVNIPENYKKMKYKLMNLQEKQCLN